MVFEMDVALNPRVVPISCLSLMLTITFYINLWMDNNSVKIVIEFTEKTLSFHVGILMISLMIAPCCR